MLDNARIVLKDVTHSGNIGACARAMKTMGLRNLSLVAPQAAHNNEQARARATRAAADILESATVYKTLPGALAGCARVFAYTARRRDLSPPLVAPRQAAAKAQEILTAGGGVAFLFGGESSGLANADIQQANFTVEIPAAKPATSLNLAQAVQIAAYELRLTAVAKPPPARGKKEMPTVAEVNAMMAHWEESLRAVGLPKNYENRLMLTRLRLLLARAEPDASEIRLLRGICRAILRGKG